MGASAVRDWLYRVRKFKREIYALYLAYRDPRVPLYARLLAACVVAYALSPVDLIPDFVPVLGHLDDAFLIPLGAALAVKLIPPQVLAECREKADAFFAETRPKIWAGVLFVIAFWLFVLLLVLSALR